MFSIVIPLFNKEKTIHQTLKSVLIQSFTEFEVIIVNDGSTDQGVEMIQKYFNDSRVRIVNQNNSGVSVARNRGVKEAKFKNIAFIDGDDEWLEDYLMKIKTVIDRFPDYGMICCAGYFKNMLNGRTSLRLAKKYKDKIVEINYFENPHVFTHTSATVVSRSAFDKTEGFPKGMKKNEDFALFFSIALQSSTIYCGYPLSIYWGGIENQSTKINSKNKFGSEIDVCKRINLTYHIWKSTNKSNRLYLVFLRYELRHIFLAHLRNNNREFLELYFKHLNEEVIEEFNALERYLYSNVSLKSISIFFILFTKIVWKSRGFPQVR